MKHQIKGQISLRLLGEPAWGTRNMLKIAGVTYAIIEGAGTSWVAIPLEEEKIFLMPEEEWKGGLQHRYQEIMPRSASVKIEGSLLP